MQAALTARLLADTDLAALVGDRINWLTRPEEDGLPAITLQVISDPRPQHFDGFQELRETRVQVDVWAQDYLAALNVTETTIAALASETTTGGTHFRRSFIDSLSDTTERLGQISIYRTTFDIVVWHSPA